MSEQKFDLFGQELNLQDCVVYPSHNQMKVGKIVKITDKMIRVREVTAPSKWAPSESLKYPSELVKAHGSEVTMYLLKING